MINGKDTFVKEINKINELVGYAQKSITPAETEIAIRYGDICFIGINNVLKCKEYFKELFLSNKHLADTYSFETFEKELLNLISVLKDESRDCTLKDYKDIIDGLMSKPIEEREIMYDVHGVVLVSPSISFGDFTFYNVQLSKDLLTQKYPRLLNGVLLYNEFSNVKIAIKVKAREQNKAFEIADKLIESFENVFSFVLSDITKTRRLRILGFREISTISRISCLSSSVGSFSEKKEVYQHIRLDDDYFRDASQGYDGVWSLITNKTKNELQSRILSSIEWIGKAINDSDRSRSFIQFIFSIEALLQTREKEFITPSIVSNLSDLLAFIISGNLEDRKKISKYVKDLYASRSAIAHGFSKTITDKELSLARQITKLMIITLQTSVAFKDMKTMDELKKHITNLKFA